MAGSSSVYALRSTAGAEERRAQSLIGHEALGFRLLALGVVAVGDRRPKPRANADGSSAMKTKVVVLGAGFGGLELTAMLSEAFGDRIDVVLIDKSDVFVFGFSKLD